MVGGGTIGAIEASRLALLPPLEVARRAADPLRGPRFTGSYIKILDHKGRVVIPSVFRGELADGLYLSAGPPGLLVGFPRDDFLRLDAAEMRNPVWIGTFRATAVFSQIDSHTGRIMIPHNLREWAGISFHDDMVVVGVGPRFLIAQAERWNDAVRTCEPFPGVAELAQL